MSAAKSTVKSTAKATVKAAAQQGSKHGAKPGNKPGTKPRAKATPMAPIQPDAPRAAKKAPGTGAKRAAAPAVARRAADEPGDALDRFDFQQDSLGYALRRAQLQAYDLFFEMLGPLELSPARLTALSLIAMAPDINQATLARRLNVAGPSVMKMIDALEAAGFIRRMDVVGDRRRYALVLTASGRAMLDTLRERLDAYEARLAERLNLSERKQLMALLGKLVG